MSRVGRDAPAPDQSRLGRLGVALLVLVAAASVSCAGARYQVKTSGLKYPVSMSGALADAEGNLYVLDHGLDDIGKLKADYTSIGFLYGETGSDVDISEEVNRQIEAVGGDGAVGVTIRTQNCGTNFIVWLAALPFYPGCMGVHVEGTIVKARRLGQPDLRVGPIYPAPPAARRVP